MGTRKRVMLKPRKPTTSTSAAGFTPRWCGAPIMHYGKVSVGDRVDMYRNDVTINDANSAEIGGVCHEPIGMHCILLSQMA